jgi:YfiH family protein
MTSRPFRDGAKFIIPDWEAPATVRALVTTRTGGVSVGPYASMNLGDHVGDAVLAVNENRRILAHLADLPSKPAWLRQVHGIDCVEYEAAAATLLDADAIVARAAGQVCAIMTADCLPVLFCARDGSVVAAAHAGWRGLLNGVLEATLGKMALPAAEVLAWLGPAIGPAAFEVGDEVRSAFVTQNALAAAAFLPAKEVGKWLCDIYQLARLRLAAAGVLHVSGGGLCTCTDVDRFYSYRRDKVSGRMASLIWVEQSQSNGLVSQR